MGAPVGAVLCGGASRRMGRDKAFVEYDGVAMAVRVAATLSAAGCGTVVAIGGDIAALTSVGLTCVEDEFPGEGPLGGVITALRQFPDAPAVMIVACDLPLLTPATVRTVLGGLASADRAVMVSMARTDRAEPMCAAWRPTALAALEAAMSAGERRLHMAAQSVGAVQSVVPAGDLTNVNTPGDLPQ